MPVEHGRRDVDQRDRGRVATGFNARPPHHQGHMQQLLPERVPMVVGAMLEQFLAMVRREDHQTRLQHAAVGEPVTQDTELRVHIGDLFIVGGDDELPGPLAAGPRVGAR